MICSATRHPAHAMNASDGSHATHRTAPSPLRPRNNQSAPRPPSRPSINSPPPPNDHATNGPLPPSPLSTVAPSPSPQSLSWLIDSHGRPGDNLQADPCQSRQGLAAQTRPSLAPPPFRALSLSAHKPKSEQPPARSSLQWVFLRPPHHTMLPTLLFHRDATPLPLSTTASYSGESSPPHAAQQWPRHGAPLPLPIWEHALQGMTHSGGYSSRKCGSAYGQPGLGDGGSDVRVWSRTG